MSTLQIGLAIAGGVVLVGVVAHSTWTSRKNKPRQAEPLPQEKIIEPGAFVPDYGQAQEPSFDEPPVFEAHHESQVAATPSIAPTYETSGGLDPVTDMARSMMEEATAHAQRVPDEAELARIAEAKAAAAKVAAERAAQQASAAPAAVPSAEHTAAAVQRNYPAVAPQFLPECRALILLLCGLQIYARLHSPPIRKHSIAVWPGL